MVELGSIERCPIPLEKPRFPSKTPGFVPRFVPRFTALCSCGLDIDGPSDGQSLHHATRIASVETEQHLYLFGQNVCPNKVRDELTKPVNLGGAVTDLKFCGGMPSERS